MDVNDIPSNLMNEIRVRFEANKDVRLLRTAQQEAQRKGDFNKALTVAQHLDNLWTICLNNYINSAEEEVCTFDTETANLPQEDKDRMMEKLMVVFMACDLINNSIMDFNSILHKTNPDLNITSFNDIRQLSDMAKQKLQYLQDYGDYMEDLVWGEKCDNLYEMALSKARSIIRKRKESKDWGENVKKLEKKLNKNKK